MIEKFVPLVLSGWLWVMNPTAVDVPVDVGGEVWWVTGATVGRVELKEPGIVSLKAPASTSVWVVVDGARHQAVEPKVSWLFPVRAGVKVAVLNPSDGQPLITFSLKTATIESATWMAVPHGQFVADLGMWLQRPGAASVDEGVDSILRVDATEPVVVAVFSCDAAHRCTAY